MYLQARSRTLYLTLSQLCKTDARVPVNVKTIRSPVLYRTAMPLQLQAQSQTLHLMPSQHRKTAKWISVKAKTIRFLMFLFTNLMKIYETCEKALYVGSDGGIAMLRRKKTLVVYISPE